MTDLRTAAEHALEALEDVKRRGRWGDFDNLTGTLRAALEADDGMYGAKALTKAYENGWNAAKAEPVQEPVAWLWQHRETGRIRLLMPNERTATDVAYAWDVVGPLYLAPPKRKPLTEDEIALIVADCSASAHRQDDFHFARAIERAHGIGEHQ